jgi:hypothetical protein
MHVFNGMVVFFMLLKKSDRNRQRLVRPCWIDHMMSISINFDRMETNSDAIGTVKSRP